MQIPRFKLTTVTFSPSLCSASEWESVVAHNERMNNIKRFLNKILDVINPISQDSEIETPIKKEESEILCDLAAGESIALVFQQNDIALIIEAKNDGYSIDLNANSALFDEIICELESLGYYMIDTDSISLTRDELEKLIQNLNPEDWRVLTESEIQQEMKIEIDEIERD